MASTVGTDVAPIILHFRTLYLIANIVLPRSTASKSKTGKGGYRLEYLRLMQHLAALVNVL